MWTIVVVALVLGIMGFGSFHAYKSQKKWESYTRPYMYRMIVVFQEDKDEQLMKGRRLQEEAKWTKNGENRYAVQSRVKKEALTRLIVKELDLKYHEVEVVSVKGKLSDIAK